MSTLYREQLMEHYKNPSNKGTLNDSSVDVNMSNPFCGDVVDLKLKIEDEKIVDVSFDGPACAVSVASSSLVTDWIKDKTLEEAKELEKDEVLEMLGVELTTSRVKCATLILEALKEAVDKYGQD